MITQEPRCEECQDYVCTMGLCTNDYMHNTGCERCPMCVDGVIEYGDDEETCWRCGGNGAVKIKSHG